MQVSCSKILPTALHTTQIWKFYVEEDCVYLSLNRTYLFVRADSLFNSFLQALFNPRSQQDSYDFEMAAWQNPQVHFHLARYI